MMSLAEAPAAWPTRRNLSHLWAQAGAVMPSGYMDIVKRLYPALTVAVSHSTELVNFADAIEEIGGDSRSRRR